MYLRVSYGFMWAPYSRYESTAIKSDIKSAYKESGAKGTVYYQKQERRNCFNCYEGQDSLIFGDYSAINTVDSFTKAS